MRILVLGGTGMLGHKMAEVLEPGNDVWTTVRGNHPISSKTVGGVDAESFDTVESALRTVRPDVVVNCIGLIKQQASAKDPLLCLTMNALLPHLLARACTEQGCRLIHISTDCVFDGRRGGYVESDLTNAEDLYGRTKALGELTSGPHLTLRTSIIGRELRSGASLVEWVLSQNGQTVKGFTHALFSGLTTLELSRVVRDAVLSHPDLQGLYHVSADPISKYDLVSLIAEAYGLDLKIVPSDELVIDRTLDSRRFQQATGYRAPSWPEMVNAMAHDPRPYSAPTAPIATA